MKKEILTKFAKDITNNDIILLKQTHGGKWYECKYISDFTDIELDAVYGVCVNGNSVDFDFKTGKNEDTIYKTFITQFINKYETKRMVLIDGEIKNKTKQECLSEFKNNNRVSKHFFYTTLYGIGVFSFFMNDSMIEHIKSNMLEYLSSNSISCNTETSEAGWVTRFMIKKDVEIHNQLLNNYEI